MPEKDTPTYPWLLERRYFPLIIVLVFVIFSAITFYICYRHHAINTAQTLKEDRSAANLLSLVLDEHLTKLVSVMESYIQRPLLLQAVREKNAEKAMVHLVNLKKSNPDVDILIITDRQGTLWAAYPERPESLGKNFAYRDWYKGVSQEWKSNISDAVLRVVKEKDLALQISVPIFNEKGEVTGILVNVQRMVGLNYLFKQVSLDPGAFITVTDRKGQIVYSTQHEVEKEIRPYPFYPEMKKVMAAKNKTFAVDDPDLSGRTRYISFAPVTNTGWTVFVERDKHGILLSGYAYYFQVAAIALLLFLIIVLFLAYSRKQFTAQYIQEQLNAEKKIRAGEESARETRDYLDKLIGYANAPIIVWDPQFIITRFNHAFEDLTGLKADEVLGREIDLLFPEERREECLGHILRTTGGECWEVIEIPILHRDGTVRTVLWNSATVYSPDGKTAIAAIAQGQDITDRKRTEEAQARLLAMLDATPGFVGYADAKDTHILYINTAGRKMVGVREQEDVTELKIADVHPEWTNKLLRDEVIPTAIRDGLWSGECAFLNRDGHEIPVMMALLAHKLPSGEVERFSTVSIDITDRKRAEEEIKKLNTELEQRVLDRTVQLSASNKELEAFSYSVSHDLRAPLRSIDGFSQALMEEYQEKLEETGKSYLERVRKATRKMGFLIDDLLKLSRVTRSEFHYETVDLSKIVRDILQTTQQNNPDRVVDVVIQEGVIVRGDPYLMQIALTNLMDNAWKFTGRETQPRIEFGATVKDGETLYFVRDNGVGFDMTYVDKLFSAFQRLHTTEEFAGTGIGLATVRRVINRHGGHVWAEGEVGKGATLYFTLPL